MDDFPEGRQPDCRVFGYLEVRHEVFCCFLITEIEGEEVCVTRYDTSHDQLHRDVLGRRAGLVEKEWLLLSSNRDAFGYAMADLRENYERYIQFYLQH